MRRYVALGFIVLGVIVAIILGKAFGAAAFYLGIYDQPLLGEYFTLTSLIGTLIGAVATYLAWRNQKLNRVSMEIASELKKVTWPGKEETRSATGVVIVTSSFVALLLWIFDQVWVHVTNLIYHA